MKSKKAFLTLFFIFLLSTLLIWSHFFHKIDSTSTSRANQLDYFINFTGFPITLDLWEAETYYPAIVVQQLIGNLVYYSNQGRYEPRLSDHWERVSEKIWKFRLREGLSCEDGELITPHSFKKSIERSLYIMAQKGGTPILKHLKGYEVFISQHRDVFSLKELEGITVDKHYITLEFTRPIRSGVIEILSFAPYGYICRKNMMPSGAWKDPKKFISSGYYRIANIALGEKYTLISRLNSEQTDFKIINIYQGLPAQEERKRPTIIDTVQPLSVEPVGLHKLSLYKEYVSLVALGNFKNGIFALRENRRIFQYVVAWIKEKNLHKYYAGPISWSLFPTQQNINPKVAEATIKKYRKIFADRITITIRGQEPSETSRGWPAWMVVRDTLEYLGIQHKFSQSPNIRADIIDQGYDLRMVMPSLGGGVEAWTLEYLFCSGLGSSLPDPSTRICNLAVDYQNGMLNDEKLINDFLRISEEDAALIPILHYGRESYFSEHLNMSSVSPLISVIRMDKLEMSR